MKRVLHVGCGRTPIQSQHSFFAPERWKEVRVDVDPQVRPDLVADITDLGAVPGGSFDALFSSHNVEHLYPHLVPVALAEFRRVLAPQGFAVVTVPDLRLVAQSILEDRLDAPLYHSPAGPVTPLDVLYGFAPAMAKGELFMAHRTGFSARTLGLALQAAGFRHVVTATHAPHFAAWAIAFPDEPPAERREALVRDIFFTAPA